MNVCERCGATIDHKSTVCRPCFGERQRARAALEREGPDRAIIAQAQTMTYSEMGREAGVSGKTIARRVGVAERRQAWLKRVRATR